MRDVKLLKERGRVGAQVSPARRGPVGQWIAAVGIFGFGFVLGAATSSPAETPPEPMSLEELASQTKALDTIAHAAQLDPRVAELSDGSAAESTASPEVANVPPATQGTSAEIEPKPSVEPIVAEGSVRESVKPVDAPLSLNKALEGLQAELSPSAGVFTVQVSSFPTTEEASAFARKLERKGFEPYVTAADIPGRGTWHRVRVGNYDSKDAAEGLRSRLAAVDVAGLVLKAKRP